MAKTKKPANGEKRVKVVLVPLPEPHRGNIPREEIRRAVHKVISERLKREAEDAAKAAAESSTPKAGETP